MLSLLSSLPEDAQSYFASFHICVRTLTLPGVPPAGVFPALGITVKLASDINLRFWLWLWLGIRLAFFYI